MHMNSNLNYKEVQEKKIESKVQINKENILNSAVLMLLEVFGKFLLSRY